MRKLNLYSSNKGITIRTYGLFDFPPTHSVRTRQFMKDIQSVAARRARYNELMLKDKEKIVYNDPSNKVCNRIKQIEFSSDYEQQIVKFFLLNGGNQVE